MLFSVLAKVFVVRCSLEARETPDVTEIKGKLYNQYLVQSKSPVAKKSVRTAVETFLVIVCLFCLILVQTMPRCPKFLVRCPFGARETQTYTLNMHIQTDLAGLSSSELTFESAKHIRMLSQWDVCVFSMNSMNSPGN